MKIIYIAFGLLLFAEFGSCQQLNSRGDLRIMFYNVENLFDTIDNPLTNDQEFLPDGTYRWNNYRYWQKLKKIYQVIAAAGEDSPPEIIGLCEVESYLALYHLTKNLPLLKYPYTIIHHDSPDERGIDVALLCRNDKVKVLTYSFLPIKMKENNIKKTREILFATIRAGNDTLHVFVNHWPSRRGGEGATEKLRVMAANTLKHSVDSLLNLNKNAKIVVMGDFNDTPADKSMSILSQSGLINVAAGVAENCKCGTLKYQSHWQIFDQVLLSQALTRNNGLRAAKESFYIFRPAFLLVTDNKFGGTKPYRTYQGPKYLGGFSDHLPILLDLFHGHVN
ncbi:MAG: hypothetical protein JXB34_12235 [Bacteroidales bacterium]|nr:hypothetical protein [Bacteroidales bacterium]